MAQAAAGRKATPRALKIIGGRGPERDSGGRVIPPAPDFTRGTPAKPAGLSAPAGRMWDLIVKQLETVSVLKPIDEFALEVGCETYARWFHAKEARLKQGGHGLLSKTSQGVGVSPLVRVEAEASRDFRAWCAEFGLTPAAEAKLVAAGENPGGNGDLF